MSSDVRETFTETTGHRLSCPVDIGRVYKRTQQVANNISDIPPLSASIKEMDAWVKQMIAVHPVPRLRNRNTAIENQPPATNPAHSAPQQARAMPIRTATKGAESAISETSPRSASTTSAPEFDGVLCRQGVAEVVDRMDVPSRMTWHRGQGEDVPVGGRYGRSRMVA